MIIPSSQAQKKRCFVLGFFMTSVLLFFLLFIQDDDEDQTPSASAQAEEKKKIPDPDSEEVSEVDVQNIIE